MNEQLVVKNFGPIKDATVDFKRVTVFIGPTSGGKSTLAKLAAIFMNNEFMDSVPTERKMFFRDYSIDKYLSASTSIDWGDDKISFSMGKEFGKNSTATSKNRSLTNEQFMRQLATDADFLELLEKYQEVKDKVANKNESQTAANHIAVMLTKFMTRNRLKKEIYVPTERMFVPAVEYSWAGLLRDDIGLPKVVLNFANLFSVAKSDVKNLDIKFLDVNYVHRNGQDFIKIPKNKALFRLYETASGIQSVTPLLVLLEHLSRNMEQAQSFIIEEPELNLYPTAQQGLLNWLVEKCTKGENDLTITTHSPYILSSCNLLLEAYKVAQQRPELADEIDKIVPRACWLNPDDFAAYYVADGTVKPITDARTHLIGGNELDAVSGDISDSFRRLLQLKKQVA